MLGRVLCSAVIVIASVGSVAADSSDICSIRQFRCNNGLCIPLTWICEGVDDCGDGSDESLPKCQVNRNCTDEEFRCGNGRCIPIRWQCDKKKDCIDGSDEEPTVCQEKVCSPEEFTCRAGRGECVPLTRMCNGISDCSDESDEKDESGDRCGKGKCQDNNGGCSQRCVDTPGGYYCDCFPGYKLMDNHKCEDIDECELPGVCSQNCINEKGTFKCQCVDGYLRDPRDHTRCKAIDYHASLLFSGRHDIRKLSLDYHEMTVIINDTENAIALDFVYRTGMMFWSDVNDQKIYKAPIDEGSERTVVIKDEVTTPDGLAVDWIYSHIYWTDTGKDTIELANFEGNMRKVLIEDRLEEPRAIALNPIDGWMFWTDWGSEPKIERAGMDGSHRQTIISYEVKWPNGLTLDLVRKRVYWVDAKLNVISSCNYDGTKRQVILYSPDSLQHPFGITTFEDWVYWTDWDKQDVFRANKFNGKDITNITATRLLYNPMGIHIYHPYRQPDGENYCQALNGPCSHLCLPAPQINIRSPKISCACPDGPRLLADGLMCDDEVKETEESPSAGTTGTSSTYTNSQSHRPVGTMNNTQLDEPSVEKSGRVTGIVIAVVTVVLILIAIILFYVYRRNLHGIARRKCFDNPLYHKTTEDQISLERNETTCPATVGEEDQEPFTRPGTNDYGVK